MMLSQIPFHVSEQSCQNLYRLTIKDEEEEMEFISLSIFFTFLIVTLFFSFFFATNYLNYHYRFRYFFFISSRDVKEEALWFFLEVDFSLHKYLNFYEKNQQEKNFYHIFYSSQKTAN